MSNSTLEKNVGKPAHQGLVDEIHRLGAGLHQSAGDGPLREAREEPRDGAPERGSDPLDRHLITPATLGQNPNPNHPLCRIIDPSGTPLPNYSQISANIQEMPKAFQESSFEFP